MAEKESWEPLWSAKERRKESQGSSAPSTASEDMPLSQLKRKLERKDIQEVKRKKSESDSMGTKIVQQPQTSGQLLKWIIAIEQLIELSASDAQLIAKPDRQLDLIAIEQLIEHQLNN